MHTYMAEKIEDREMKRKKFIKQMYNSKRNTMADNWFGSVELALLILIFVGKK